MILKIKELSFFQGTISKSEWEVITMYKVFAFQKLSVSDETVDESKS